MFVATRDSIISVKGKKLRSTVLKLVTKRYTGGDVDVASKAEKRWQAPGRDFSVGSSPASGYIGCTINQLAFCWNNYTLHWRIFHPRPFNREHR